MADFKNFELKGAGFLSHLSLIQYDKMKGVTIEMCNGPESAGLMFNNAQPEDVVQFLQSIIDVIQVKKYPIQYGEFSIKDAVHECRIVDVISDHILRCTGGKAAGQNRHLNHLYHLKQRISKGQRLTPKMQENLAWVMKETDRIYYGGV